MHSTPVIVMINFRYIIAEKIQVGEKSISCTQLENYLSTYYDDLSQGLDFFLSIQYSSQEKSIPESLVVRLQQELYLKTPDQARRIWVDYKNSDQHQEDQPLEDSLLDAIKFYYLERSSTLAIMSSLVRICEDDGHPFHHVSQEFVKKIIGNDFTLHLINQLKKNFENWDQNNSSYSLAMLQRIKCILNEQAELLQTLFVFCYRVTWLSSNVLKDLFDWMIIVDFGLKQPFSGIFDGECRELRQNVIYLMLLCFLENLNLESLLAGQLKNIGILDDSLIDTDAKISKLGKEPLHSFVLFVWSVFLCRLHVVFDEYGIPNGLEQVAAHISSHVFGTRVERYKIYVAKSFQLEVLCFLQSILTSVVFVGEENVFGYGEVIKGLLMTFMECFQVENVPKFDDFVSLFQQLFNQQSYLCLEFWEQDYKVHARRGVVDAVKQSFPLNFEIFGVARSLCGNKRTAHYVFMMLDQITGWTEELNSKTQNQIELIITDSQREYILTRPCPVSYHHGLSRVNLPQGTVGVLASNSKEIIRWSYNYSIWTYIYYILNSVKDIDGKSVPMIDLLTHICQYEKVFLMVQERRPNDQRSLLEIACILLEQSLKGDVKVTAAAFSLVAVLIVRVPWREAEICIERVISFLFSKRNVVFKWLQDMEIRKGKYPWTLSFVRFSQVLCSHMHNLAVKMQIQLVKYSVIINSLVALIVEDVLPFYDGWRYYDVKEKIELSDHLTNLLLLFQRWNVLTGVQWTAPLCTLIRESESLVHEMYRSRRNDSGELLEQSVTRAMDILAIAPQSLADGLAVAKWIPFPFNVDLSLSAMRLLRLLCRRNNGVLCGSDVAFIVSLCNDLIFDKETREDVQSEFINVLTSFAEHQKDFCLLLFKQKSPELLLDIAGDSVKLTIARFFSILWIHYSDYAVAVDAIRSKDIFGWIEKLLPVTKQMDLDSIHILSFVNTILAIEIESFCIRNEPLPEKMTLLIGKLPISVMLNECVDLKHSREYETVMAVMTRTYDLNLLKKHLIRVEYDNFQDSISIRDLNRCLSFMEAQLMCYRSLVQLLGLMLVKNISAAPLGKTISEWLTLCRENNSNFECLIHVETLKLVSSWMISRRNSFPCDLVAKVIEISNIAIERGIPAGDLISILVGSSLVLLEKNSAEARDVYSSLLSLVIPMIGTSKATLSILSIISQSLELYSQHSYLLVALFHQTQLFAILLAPWNGDRRYDGLECAFLECLVKLASDEFICEQIAPHLHCFLRESFLGEKEWTWVLRLFNQILRFYLGKRDDTLFNALAFVNLYSDRFNDQFTDNKYDLSRIEAVNLFFLFLSHHYASWRVDYKHISDALVSKTMQLSCQLICLLVYPLRQRLNLERSKLIPNIGMMIETLIVLTDASCVLSKPIAEWPINETSMIRHTLKVQETLSFGALIEYIEELHRLKEYPDLLESAAAFIMMQYLLGCARTLLLGIDSFQYRQEVGSEMFRLYNLLNIKGTLFERLKELMDQFV